MSKIRVANALACEFTAEGVRNKHTAVNIYTGDILVNAFPAQIAMAFYIELMPDFTGTPMGKVSIMFGNALLASLEAQFTFQQRNPNILLLPQAMVKMPKAGKVRIVVEIEGQKPFTALSKSIRLMPDPLPTA